MTIRVNVCSSISQIDENQWNGLVKNNYPFLNHALLYAMEQEKCVGEHVGWITKHLVCYQDDKLIGALPLYEKHNSWGEYVFDHAWADAYNRFNLDYYPKLINAIPFTPAMGQRLLSDDNQDTVKLLLNAANNFSENYGYSGLHCLFPSDENYSDLNQNNAFMRMDCQYHWTNSGYQGFDEFLNTLKHKKRKNIKQERKKVLQQNIHIKRYDGNTATPFHWLCFTQLYQAIYDRKYGIPAFNCDFFMRVAKAIPDQILLLLAFHQGKAVAGALMYHDKETLYGRHWGCNHYLDCLHFELCYYQGIEFCIRHGLKRFDPGAQGEHKIPRGFLPVKTRSLHWLCDSLFKEAIENFVAREQNYINHYIQSVKKNSPYKESTI